LRFFKLLGRDLFFSLSFRKLTIKFVNLLLCSKMHHHFILAKHFSFIIKNCMFVISFTFNIIVQIALFLDFKPSLLHKRNDILFCLE